MFETVNSVASTVHAVYSIKSKKIKQVEKKFTVCVCVRVFERGVCVYVCVAS